LDISLIAFLKLFIFVVFIALSAFFSGSETAYTAISKLKLRGLEDKKVKGSRRLVRLLENRKRLITAILIGNNISNVAASALATAVFLALFQKLGVRNFASAMTVVTITMTVVLLIFGEITPKIFAIRNPSQWAIRFSRPIALFLALFKPFIWLFEGIASVASKFCGVSSDDFAQVLTADEIKTMVQMGAEEGILEKEEKEMITSIFKFSNTVVREIMTPRTDAVCLENDSAISECINLIKEKGHSRIPIYEDKIDNIVGIIYAKDLLTVERGENSPNILKFLRDPVFIPETKNIVELLRQMKKSRFHMAIVVDEYGGMSGLVTLEDIIEEIIGDINDEYDREEESDFIEVRPNVFYVDAKIHCDDLGEKLNVEFPEDEDFDSLGGLVLDMLGEFPAKGEILEYKNLEIHVKDVGKRRIKKLEIIKHPEKVSKENNEEDEVDDK
jgi:putative hemolysin